MEGEVFWSVDEGASTAEFVRINDDLFELIARTYHDEANLRLNRSELLALRDAINIVLTARG